MTDLTPLYALGGSAPRQETINGIALAEQADLALASLACSGSAPTQLGPTQLGLTPFGLTLPDPGKLTASDRYGAIWMGPGQWMIEAEGQADSNFAARLRLEAPGCAVTDQTDGWVCIDIRAKPALLEHLLSKLVNLDPARVTAGTAHRTGLEHLSVTLLRRAEDHLVFMTLRSQAESLWHALEKAARL